MTPWLAPAHLALAIIILTWDMVLAGRIAQLRQAPRAFQAISGLAGLLVLPAALLALATSTIITSRAVATMDWVWPAVLILFAAQAGYALTHRLVNLLWGVPIAVYDALIALIGAIQYLIAHGHALPIPLVTLLAAQKTSMVVISGTQAAIWTPFYLNVPMVSPAFPALRNITAFFRAVMAFIAVVWVLFIVAIGAPRADAALRASEEHRNDRLRERPDADFAVGIKILPDVRVFPSAAAVRSDLELVDTLDVDAVCVVVVPDAGRIVIDSLARVLEPIRRDSTTLIVALGYRGKLDPEIAPLPLAAPERLVTLERLVRRVHPDILLPAEDPYGSGARSLGRLPVEEWKAYLLSAARAVRAIDRHVKIGVSVSSFSSRDSALYAWAASPGGPIDIVGFSFFPTPYVARDLDARERAADRWMRATPPRKEHWVFATGGYPLAYGEVSQERAIWQALARATEHAAIKGLVVYEAWDYGQSRGLRAPNGRLRAAAAAVMRAIRGLRESAR